MLRRPLTPHRTSRPADGPAVHPAARPSTSGISRECSAGSSGSALLRRPLKGVYVDRSADDGLLMRTARRRPRRAAAPPSSTDRTARLAARRSTRSVPATTLVPPPVEVFQPPGTHPSPQDRDVRRRAHAAGPRRRDRRTASASRHRCRTALDLGRLTRRDHAIAALDALLQLGRFDRSSPCSTSSGASAASEASYSCGSWRPSPTAALSHPASRCSGCRWLDTRPARARAPGRGPRSTACSGPGSRPRRRGAPLRRGVRRLGLAPSSAAQRAH